MVERKVFPAAKSELSGEGGGEGNWGAKLRGVRNILASPKIGVRNILAKYRCYETYWLNLEAYEGFRGYETFSVN